MAKDEVLQGLNLVLANSYALYLKTQCYHWNVVGKNFWALHKLLEEQYQDLTESIDEIAERIRALGEFVNGNLSAFDHLSSMSDAEVGASSEKIIQDLIEDNLNMSALLEKTAEIAATLGDKGTEDLLIGRIQAHQKNAWMLKSSQ